MHFLCEFQTLYIWNKLMKWREIDDKLKMLTPDEQIGIENFN